MKSLPKTSSDSQWRTFDRDGYLRLGQVVTEAELEGLRLRIDEIMLGRADVPFDRMMMQLDTVTGLYEDMDPQSLGHKGATLAYRKILGLEFDPLYLAYMQKPLFRGICQRAYGVDVPISIYWAMFMNKPAERGTVLPWHWDHYVGLDRPPGAIVWMALDDSTLANGCIQVLPGTHQLFPDIDVLGKEQIAEALATHEPETLECSAGEAILLHNKLLHTSSVNSTDTPRRAISISYLDGRTMSSEGITFSRIFGLGALEPEKLGTAAG